MYGSMHIEFSLAEIYPRPQLARVIVHEATHKFAHTGDICYCLRLGDPSLPGLVTNYETVGAFDKTHNADSYTYTYSQFTVVN
jgi:hypothetical protein